MALFYCSRHYKEFEKKSVNCVCLFDWLASCSTRLSTRIFENAVWNCEATERSLNFSRWEGMLSVKQKLMGRGSFGDKLWPWIRCGLSVSQVSIRLYVPRRTVYSLSTVLKFVIFCAILFETDCIPSIGMWVKCSWKYIYSDWAKIHVIVWQPLLSVGNNDEKLRECGRIEAAQKAKSKMHAFDPKIVLYVMAIWFQRQNRCARSWHGSPFLPSETIAWGDADSWGDLSTAWSCSTTIVRKLWIALKPAHIIGA